MKTHVRKGLVIVAKVVQWLGALWVVYFVGDAALAIARDARFSDAVADAVPLLLVGGVGCALAWSIAVIIRGIAQKKQRQTDQDHLERRGSR